MDYNFANGTAEQRSRWEQAAKLLLNLPFEAIPLTVDVEFVDPGVLAADGHTSLAATTFTVGSSSSSMKVRDDAPDFGDADQGLIAEAKGLGLDYSVASFYTETSAHELGHAFFAALPEEIRDQIAQLFGAPDASPGSMEAGVGKWQDRLGEGIAETFKEAFLPRRFRVFPNRTNRTIAYADFPRFRELFRQGSEGIEGGEGEGPAYNLDIFRKGGYTSSIKWADERGGLFVGRQGGFGGLFNFHSKSDFQIPAVEAHGGHHFSFDWEIPREVFVDATPEFFETNYGAYLYISFEATDDKGNFLSRWRLYLEGVWIQEEELEKKEEDPAFQGITATVAGPGGASFCWFGKISGNVGAFPAEPEGEIVNPPTITGGGGLGGLLPPLKIHCEFDYEWPVGELRTPDIKAWLEYGFLNRPELEFIEILRDTIPDFPFKQTEGGGEPGAPIDRVVPELAPGGDRAGVVPKKGRLVGGRI